MSSSNHRSHGYCCLSEYAIGLNVRITWGLLKLPSPTPLIVILHRARRGAQVELSGKALQMILTLVIEAREVNHCPVLELFAPCHLSQPSP